MNLIYVRGYIEDRWAKSRRRRVRGFAFQVPGFEFFRTWATPGMWPNEGKWVISHWESGMTIGTAAGVFGINPLCAAKLAVPFLQSKGADFVRERMTSLGYPCDDILHGEGK